MYPIEFDGSTLTLRPGWRKSLAGMRPCDAAMCWLGERDPATAWDECERGDWMLWLLGRLSPIVDSPQRRSLVLMACKCARRSLHHVPEGEVRPLKAIEAAESWVRGDESLANVRSAAAAAYAAAYAADAAAAAARGSTLRRCADIVREAVKIEVKHG